MQVNTKGGIQPAGAKLEQATRSVEPAMEGDIHSAAPHLEEATQSVGAAKIQSVQTV